MSARAAGVVVWITGLPSSGKSTLARGLRRALDEAGRPACVLDGDEVREVLVPRPGYAPAERDAFYDTLAGLAALLARQGLVVVVAATAPRRAHRELARARAPRFVEVLVRVPIEECMRRDAKGLYEKARRGQLPDVPGVGAAYEEPGSPDVIASGGDDEDAVARVVARLEAG